MSGMTKIRLGDLSSRKPTRFLIEPDADERAEIAAEIDLSALRKIRFSGEVAPQGKRDWHLEAVLGATVVQPCVVSFAPVTTRIDVTVQRNYLSDLPAPGTGEVEAPEDDTIEALPDEIDLWQLMIEALSLEVPDFPRAEGVDPVDLSVTPPGAEPLDGERAKPFAGLAALKDKLDGGSER